MLLLLRSQTCLLEISKFCQWLPYLLWMICSIYFFVIYKQLWKLTIFVLIMFQGITTDHRDTQFSHNPLRNYLVQLFAQVLTKMLLTMWQQYWSWTKTAMDCLRLSIYIWAQLICIYTKTTHNRPGKLLTIPYNLFKKKNPDVSL